MVLPAAVVIVPPVAEKAPISPKTFFAELPTYFPLIKSAINPVLLNSLLIFLNPISHFLIA
jgi:hypothetical protein